ncbi:hypothetical protein SAMN05421541_11688 [Actinoplanes philippinensis]|uniref:Uncharacterized protein n=2 Tax=Actinoplanes philippinensis TaxID=35752 RepID=A0A1I2KDM0_9ACTN|nr:hypothetical protein SAMN05421541_11688 [Actinoplanes philippinensis]
MTDSPNRYVEELFDDEAEAPFGMTQVWTPELHRGVMDMIRNAPRPRTPAIEKYLTVMPKFSDHEVIEVAAYWTDHCTDEPPATRPGPSFLANPKPVDLTTKILEYAISAALRLYDRRRAADWYARWRDRRTGRPVKRHSSMYSFFEGGFDNCLECVRDMDELSGGFDRDCAELLRSVRPAADLTEREVALIAWVTAQRHPAIRFLAQHAANRLWYVDLFRRDVFVFSGRAVTPCPIPFTVNPVTIADYVRDASRCDQRVVAWSGKHTYRVAQRYGRHVLIMTSSYYGPSRGQAEMDYAVWLSPATPDEATTLVDDFAASLPATYRKIALWYDPRRGSVMRSYTGEHPIGVWGKHWMSGLGVDRTFGSEQEAIAALEAQELDWLKAGKRLDNFYLRLPNTPT